MDYEYSSIDGDKRGRQWLWKVNIIGAVSIGALLVAALSSMATFGILTWIEIHSPRQLSCANTVDEVLSPQKFSCGETFDEAHQRGCTFDALTLTWLHPKCSLYGQQEFLGVSKISSNGTWRHWEDRDAQHELGGHEALSYLPTGESYWMTQEEHIYHCMFMMLRVHDAAVNGKRLDSKSSSSEHAKHCMEMLVEQAKIGLGETISQSNVKGFSKDIGWTAC